MGYKIGTKGYILFDLTTRSIFISRHAIFHEEIFPYTNLHDANAGNRIHSDVVDDPLIFDDSFMSIPNSQKQIQQIQSDSSQPETIVDSPLNNMEQTILRKSNRIIKPPGYLKDFQCNTVLTNSNLLYPISNYMSYEKISSFHYAFISSITTHHEPSSFDEAVQHEC